MNWHVLLYNALLLGCAAYALGRGGAPERIDVAIIIVGSGLTKLAYSSLPVLFQSVEVKLFAVDVAVLLAFLAVSQRANRAWPIAVSGFQMAAVGVHLAKALTVTGEPFGYGVLLALPGYLMLACIAIGTRRHRRRVATYGHDRAWSKGTG